MNTELYKLRHDDTVDKKKEKSRIDRIIERTEWFERDFVRMGIDQYIINNIQETNKKLSIDEIEQIHKRKYQEHGYSEKYFVSQLIEYR